MYPSAGEAVSLAVFAKHFSNPIERVGLGSGGTSVGIELRQREGGRQLRRRVECGRDSASSAVPHRLAFFANVTAMSSKIQVDDRVAARPMRPPNGRPGAVRGQRGVDLHPKRGGTSATSLYNVVGRSHRGGRGSPLPDVYEHAT